MNYKEQISFVLLSCISITIASLQSFSMLWFKWHGHNILFTGWSRSVTSVIVAMVTGFHAVVAMVTG